MCPRLHPANRVIAAESASLRRFIRDATTLAGVRASCARGAPVKQAYPTAASGPKWFPGSHPPKGSGNQGTTWVRPSPLLALLTPLGGGGRPALDPTGSGAGSPRPRGGMGEHTYPFTWVPRQTRGLLPSIRSGGSWGDLRRVPTPSSLLRRMPHACDSSCRTSVRRRLPSRCSCRRGT